MTPAPKNKNDQKLLLPERPKDKIIIKPSNLRTPNSQRSKNELNKNSTNVKFRFDRKSTELTAPEGDLDENGNGNYDYILPFENIPQSKTQDVKAQQTPIQSSDNPHVQPNNESNHSTNTSTNNSNIKKSNTNNNIPIIKDVSNQNSTNAQTYQNKRIITLVPKNYEFHYLKKLSEEIEPFEFKHDFIEFKCEVHHHRICQYCHRVMGIELALRCISCSFICHKKCSEYHHQVSALEIYYINI